MLELLIRLHQMRCCCDRVRRNSQLTQREKYAAHRHKQIVRECLPPEVLKQYDRMKRTERALRSCPEVFAMAVIVSTFRNLSLQEKKQLVAHFPSPPKRRSLVSQNTTVKPRGHTPARSGAGTGKTSR